MLIEVSFTTRRRSDERILRAGDRLLLDAPRRWSGRWPPRVRRRDPQSNHPGAGIRWMEISRSRAVRRWTAGVQKHLRDLLDRTLRWSRQRRPSNASSAGGKCGLIGVEQAGEAKRLAVLLRRRELGCLGCPARDRRRGTGRSARPDGRASAREPRTTRPAAPAWRRRRGRRGGGAGPRPRPARPSTSRWR